MATVAAAFLEISLDPDQCKDYNQFQGFVVYNLYGILQAQVSSENCH